MKVYVASSWRNNSEARKVCVGTLDTTGNCQCGLPIEVQDAKEDA